MKPNFVFTPYEFGKLTAVLVDEVRKHSEPCNLCIGRVFTSKCSHCVGFDKFFPCKSKFAERDAIFKINTEDEEQ